MRLFRFQTYSIHSFQLLLHSRMHHSECVYSIKKFVLFLHFFQEGIRFVCYERKTEDSYKLYYATRLSKAERNNFVWMERGPTISIFFKAQRQFTRRRSIPGPLPIPMSPLYKVIPLHAIRTMRSLEIVVSDSGPQYIYSREGRVSKLAEPFSVPKERLKET